MTLVQEHTFIRFSQYAYTGDYIIVDLEILLDSSAIGTTESALIEVLPNSL